MIEFAEALARSIQRDEKKWYAIYVRSRYEKKVSKLLVEKGVETFLPLIEEVRIWSDRKKKVEEPLFKGYVFVRIDLRNRLGVLQTEGVVRLVGFGRDPSPIPQKEIDWIKVVLNSPSIAKQGIRRESFPSLGERVEVLSGPMRGLQGVVAEYRGNTRLVIQIEAIARAFSVEVRPELLRRLD